MHLTEIKHYLNTEYNLFSEIFMKIDKDTAIFLLENTFIAGGCIYSLYNDLKINDYDIFCKSKPVVARLSKFIKQNIKSFEAHGYKVSFTSFAISLEINNIKYQIITKYYGSPEDVVNEFDCLHNMAYYDFKTNEVNILSDEKYLDSNILRFNTKRCRDLCQSIMRISKYNQRGFKIYKSEIRKMLLKLYDTGFDIKEMELLKSRNEY